MNSYPIHIKPFGERAILIEWPKEIERSILDDILTFKDFLRSEGYGPGQWELVAAYNSLALINNKSKIDFKELSADLQKLYPLRKEGVKQESRLWRLPVCYDEEFGIDLEEVSEQTGKTIEEVISLHTSATYTVYGIGFLPGFLYLGGVPAELVLPRRAAPRLHVKKGSVGLARKQTGVYPQDCPGGWNLIGNCPVPIFNAEKENPCLIRVGDRVQFYSIPRAQFDLHTIQAEVGLDLLTKESNSA
ncbi:5-oxoprolinase subunit PxpB [Muriicola sp. E247]|uniref:5-oxoprolinase subunit PxpB n=1 Tax=Muriicola sp. E247 TaxID=3242730 RepID=UPI003525A4F6